MSSQSAAGQMRALCRGGVILRLMVGLLRLLLGLVPSLWCEQVCGAACVTESEKGGGGEGERKKEGVGGERIANAT